ncbi:MAG: triose-phosphate isomerase [bacterium]
MSPFNQNDRFEREMIIAGNWKMHTTPSEGAILARQVAEAVESINGVRVVIFPPATHLLPIVNIVRETKVEVGVQNVHWETKGAYTGEISAPMAVGVGTQWAIIGHSERRKWFGETDYTVRLRAAQALASGLRPIVCIGETLAQRRAGMTFDLLRHQVEIAIAPLPLKGKNGLVIAYEPVWAIGTGVNATPDQAQEAHCFIRQTLSGIFGSVVAQGTAILYGGSVTPENAQELLECPDVNGALVGGASLNPEGFAQIVRIASQVKKQKTPV